MFDFTHDYLLFGWNGLTDFIIPFIIVLSILVFVHEWGHYIVARMCGVRVEKFSIGFGKELFGYTDKSGTRWKFSLIPLGGYVQMFGDTDPASAYNNEIIGDDEDDKRPMTADEKKVAFFNKPVWQRALIVFAGPAINFIFAILLLVGLYTTVGKPVTPPVAAAVIVGGAADIAGMQPHDRVIAIDGKSIESFSDIQRQVAVSLDRELTLSVMRDEKQIELKVTPVLTEMEDRFGFKHSRGMMGMIGAGMALSLDDVQTLNGKELSDLSVAEKKVRFQKILDGSATITLPSNSETGNEMRVAPYAKANPDLDNTIILTESAGKDIVVYGPLEASTAAVKETWFVITGTLEALGQIITGVRSTDELGGIIRIGAIAGDAAAAGIITLISFTAMLSINLGLINLFPIPLLDGGHLVFYAYEGVFKKPMHERVMDYAMKFGLVFLVCLMLYANLNDLVQMIM
jgi:regulator of sigma E protease